jgi:hypothetical protein
MSASDVCESDIDTGTPASQPQNDFMKYFSRAQANATNPKPLIAAKKRKR